MEMYRRVRFFLFEILSQHFKKYSVFPFYWRTERSLGHWVCEAESTSMSGSCKNKLFKHIVIVTWLSFRNYSNTYKKKNLIYHVLLQFLITTVSFVLYILIIPHNLSKDFVQRWHNKNLHSSSFWITQLFTPKNLQTNKRLTGIYF